MNQKHSHTCSDLITVHLQTSDGREEKLVAILEDISASGARLQLERPIPTHTGIRMVCSSCEAHCEFGGQVVDSHFHDGIGYFTEVVFKPGTVWSPEQYRPKHLLDISGRSDRAERQVRVVNACCCEGTVCPNEIISRVIEPLVPLAERVRDVGRQVAKVCGTMNEAEASECFSNLFLTPPVCRLFHEFMAAYRVQREKMEKQPVIEGDLIEHINRMAQSLISIPEEALGH
jgi:hypothetical protein